jgi:predicted Fe-Mo cluster-binding NifX family protein
MKIAVSATGDNLDVELDPRFGRCQFFVFVDPDSMEFEAMSNDSATAMGGAGIQAAQSVINHDVEVVLTGNIGPNAFQTLSTAGIKVITGASGKIKNVIEDFKNGKFKEIKEPNVTNHFGMGGGGGGASGGRGGQGRGKGRGGGGRGQGIRKLD